MSLIDEIKQDKERLADQISHLIQCFEDKHGCVEVGEIKPHKIALTGPNYGMVAVSFSCHINGIT